MVSLPNEAYVVMKLLSVQEANGLFLCCKGMVNISILQIQHRIKIINR